MCVIGVTVEGYERMDNPISCRGGRAEFGLWVQSPWSCRSVSQGEREYEGVRWEKGGWNMAMKKQKEQTYPTMGVIMD